MMQEDEKAKVIQVFGGKKGIIDSSVPSLLFVFTQSIAHNLKISLIVKPTTNFLFFVRYINPELTP